MLVGVFGLTGTIFLQYLAFDTAPLVGANVICYVEGLLAAIWVAAAARSRRSYTPIRCHMIKPWTSCASSGDLQLTSNMLRPTLIPTTVASLIAVSAAVM